VSPALLVVLAGVAAALHVGKLAPAVGALQTALGMTLVQAGFLLSVVQLAGMTAGLLLGLLGDRIGARRSVVVGLLLLALASAAGGMAHSAAMLLGLRALEGLGFLLVVLPAPGLVRRLAAPDRAAAVLGLWGAYMPLGTALALLLGPLCVQALGWRLWWWALAAVSALMAAWVWLVVSLPGRPTSRPASPVATLRQTLASSGPWLVALAFGAYSAQWLAVIGFLPTLVAQAGASAAAVGGLSAGVALCNVLGNVAAGRLLQRGWAAPTLLRLGYAVMALAAVVAFAWPKVPPLAAYAALLLFSGVGGLIPATLFALALRVAPGEHAVATTVGWMQQWSAAGQFIGPPAVAWLAARSGTWQLTWVFTGLCCLTGAVLTALLARRLRAMS
jgi:MFS transporter, CP family, cyanate transporter